MNKYNEDSLLTRKEAASFLGCTEITLAQWKSTNQYSLSVVKVGGLDNK